SVGGSEGASVEGSVMVGVTVGSPVMVGGTVGSEVSVGVGGSGRHVRVTVAVTVSVTVTGGAVTVTVGPGSSHILVLGLPRSQWSPRPSRLLTWPEPSVTVSPTRTVRHLLRLQTRCLTLNLAAFSYVTVTSR